MARVAVVGLGKMGISHLAIARATPGVEIAAVCDASGYLLGVLRKYTGVRTFSNLDKMLAAVDLDAVIIATPSSLHAPMVRSAIRRGVHVFCEKPFVLDVTDGERLVDEAHAAGVVTQVGYHNRYVGAFREVKSLLGQRAIGEVTHILGEAYGPVVLKPQGGTWRSKSAEGGGSLYDFAAHPLNLINWYVGAPQAVAGTVLNPIFSREIDDEAYSTLYFDTGQSAALSVNWSDESVRKMTTRITVWGTKGRIFADRQECQVYLRGPEVPDGYQVGWNVRYTTALTEPVAFYLRGEEYSAQLEEFVRRVEAGKTEGENDFASALVTDRTIAMLRADAAAPRTTAAAVPADRSKPAWPGWRAWRDQALVSPAAERARSGAHAARRKLSDWRGA
jgi:predicted dehydrogenase